MSQEHQGPRRKRDREAERAERESFIVLQHAYTLSEGTPGDPIPCERLGLDLGFDTDQIARLLRHLVWVDYLAEENDGRRVSITPEGAEYIERLAGRRRSVRADDHAVASAPPTR